MFSKYAPHILPLGGDTPFYAFGYEIEDFYLTRKKTGRRYGQLLKFVLQFHSYGCVRFYLMRRDVTRRYKQRLPVSTINIQFYRKTDRKYPHQFARDFR